LAQIRNEEKADLGQISRLMLNDAAITASLLRVANSATFAGLAAVSDLDQAIGRLGLRQVGATVTALAHRGLFRPPSPERTEMLRGMWDHARASAITTRTLAESEGADAVESYLAGLLHDTGKLLVLKGIDDLEQRSGTTRLKPETVVELMEALHGELGCGVLRAWRIAEPICRVTLHHHDHLVATDDRLLLRV